MPITKASNTHERTKRIMAIGPVRAGKTFGFCTIPGRKFAWVFDPNAIDTLRRYAPDCDCGVFLPDNLNTNALTLAANRGDRYVTVKEPKAYLEFSEEFERFWGDPSYPYYIENYDAVLFDGMTAFQALVMDRMLWLNGRSGKWPEQADWTGTMNTVTSVMRTMAAWPIILYTTVHTDYKDTKLYGPIQQLKLIGELRNSLPGLFTDLWYFTAGLDDKNEPFYQVQTRSDDDKRMLGTSDTRLKPFEIVTVNDKFPIEGQGVGRLLATMGVVP